MEETQVQSFRFRAPGPFLKASLPSFRFEDVTVLNHTTGLEAD